MSNIKEIAEAIQRDSNYTFVEGAFRCYVDNQITEKELEQLLLDVEYKLPKNFFSLPARLKKTYFSHTLTYLINDNGNVSYETYAIYNKPYFFDLAKNARKNKTLTKELITYFSYIGVNINLLFLGMEYIEIKNTNLFKYSTIMQYASDNKINDLYDLLTSIYSEELSKDGIKQLRNLLMKQLCSDAFFSIDLTDPFYSFALLIECILHTLPRKEANTIKVKFQILEKNQLRDIDYYDDEKHQTKIINTFKKKVNKSRLVLNVFGFVIEHKKEFDSFPPNGYSSIYYYLMEEGY